MSKEILVLSGHGIDLRLNSGRLKIKSGFPIEGNVQETFIYRGINDVEHLVIIGHSGAITFEAIRWIIDQEIMVTFLDHDGNSITNFLSENHISGITKRRQATASNELNLNIARWLLSQKFQRQRNTLKHINSICNNYKWWNSDWDYKFDQAISISKEREKSLANFHKTDSLRTLEAQAAAAYWHCFEGIPLK